MSNKLYRPRRKRRKEKLSLIDKIEIGGITIAAVVLIGWSSWSIVDSFTPDPVIPSREIYTDGVSSYIAGLTSDSDSADEESASATGTDGSDTDTKDTDSDENNTSKKEEKDDKTDSEKEKEKETEVTTSTDTQKATDETAKSQAEATATPSQAAEAADTNTAAPTETATVPTSYFKHPLCTGRESTGHCQLPGWRNFKCNRGRLCTCRMAEGNQKRS